VNEFIQNFGNQVLETGHQKTVEICSDIVRIIVTKMCYEVGKCAIVVRGVESSCSTITELSLIHSLRQLFTTYCTGLNIRDTV
jgi:hypothetical protein